MERYRSFLYAMNHQKKPIPSVVYMIHQAIVAITQHLPKGTNKPIHDALLTIMSGRLLETRGAIIPALTFMNLSPNAVLRTREAIAEGAWTRRGLLKRLWNWLETQGQWKPLEVGGYRVNALIWL